MRLILILIVSFGLSNYAYANSGAMASGLDVAGKAATTAGVNTADGTGHMAKCVQPHGQYFCMRSAMSYGSAAMMILSTLASLKTAKAAAPNSPDLPNFDFPSFDPTSFGKSVPDVDGDGVIGYKDMKAAIAKGNATLEKMGYSLSPDGKTVSTPNGDFPVEDIMDPTAMGSAGFSANDVDLANAQTQKLAMASHGIQPINVKPNIVGREFENRGGGGSRYTAPKFEKTDYSALFGDGRGPASAQKDLIAGKTRSLGNGELIGVSVDDIFKMMSRRYKAKRENKNFIDQ